MESGGFLRTGMNSFFPLSFSSFTCKYLIKTCVVNKEWEMRNLEDKVEVSSEYWGGIQKMPVISLHQVPCFPACVPSDVSWDSHLRTHWYKEFRMRDEGRLLNFCFTHVVYCNTCFCYVYLISCILEYPLKFDFFSPEMENI